MEGPERFHRFSFRQVFNRHNFVAVKTDTQTWFKLKAMSLVAKELPQKSQALGVIERKEVDIVSSAAYISSHAVQIQWRKKTVFRFSLSRAGVREENIFKTHATDIKL